MTINQILSFITAAEYLNFTKAASKLYITQPALSRHISTMEAELNMQLFIRENRNVRLTPAGVLLYQRFSEIYADYIEAIDAAGNINRGLSMELSIGILDGTYTDDFLPRMISTMNQKYPNLTINLYSRSFSGLLDGLYNKKLDMVLSLEFNVEEQPELIYDVLEHTSDNLVIHQNDPLYEKKDFSLEDMDGHNLLVIADSDMAVMTQYVLKEYQRRHVSPNIRFVPDLQTCMLELKAGMGAAYLFGRSELRFNTNLRFIETDSPWKTGLVLAWHKDNLNPCIPIIAEWCKQNVSSLNG